MKTLCVLGSTGSIGVSTLDVVARHPDKYRVVALTANKNVDDLYQQCLRHRPEYAVMVDAGAASDLQSKISASSADHVQVLSGAEALAKVASLPDVNTVMAAIVGAAGLLPTLAAANAGHTVLLANKEALVMSGTLLMQAVADNNAVLLPIDSEHNAIFQSMPADYTIGQQAHGVRKILLTASGGPFRTLPIEKLDAVTPEQAVAHPNWDMGRKISVDSATMMNKGLELIEACLLFSMPAKAIQIVIHPQSVIHSMVDYDDGSVLAQLGNPDMRTPIAHSLAWPNRIDSGVEPLDIFQVKTLDFEPPDEARFPCLKLAVDAAELGGTRPTVLNAGNEVAVEAFLDSRIRFTDIPKVIEQCLSDVEQSMPDCINSILKVDANARDAANEFITHLTR
ncbi:MAG: 1-deoxy-D-xylulose-5-phosphate reductoisomerase [Methylococcales bacterium]